MRRLGYLAILLAVSGCASRAPIERKWPVMGTFATVSVDGPEAAVDAARDAFDGVDRSMSNWSPASDLSRLNEAARRGAAPVEDPDLLACVARAFEAARATEGAFDPTVGPLMTLWGYRPRAKRTPTDAEIASTLRQVGHEKVRLEGGTIRFEAPGMEIDLGGIAKGCALDLARERVVAAGARSALLDLGGNLMAVGRPPSGRHWEFGVKDPRDPDRVAGVVEVSEGSVSTSGSYENPGHIMDPRTGRSAETDVLAATVVAPSGAEADALSTALCVAGSAAAPRILERFRGARAVLFLKDGRVVVSDGLRWRP
jgi:thiamine biosynthesis lipoprotein